MHIVYIGSHGFSAFGTGLSLAIIVGSIYGCVRLVIDGVRLIGRGPLRPDKEFGEKLRK